MNWKRRALKLCRAPGSSGYPGRKEGRRKNPPRARRERSCEEKSSSPAPSPAKINQGSLSHQGRGGFLKGVFTWSSSLPSVGERLGEKGAGRALLPDRNFF